jgi:hypothetical protein
VMSHVLFFHPLPLWYCEFLRVHVLHNKIQKSDILLF